MKLSRFASGGGEPALGVVVDEGIVDLSLTEVSAEPAAALDEVGQEQLA